MIHFSELLRGAAGSLSAHECAKAVSPLLSHRTVQNWKSGANSPPAWAQSWLLTRIKRARIRAERVKPLRDAGT